MKRWVLSFIVLLAAAGPAAAWGIEGHVAIGDVARTLLTPKARAAVTAILGTDDLGSLANWADDVRSAAFGRGPLAGDAEAARLNREFPDNGSWHFVDLPLGSNGYPRGASPFTSNHDVVHVIDRCIQILTHPKPIARVNAASSVSQAPELTRAEALKYLIHLVGDVHQPLHVGCGYYRMGATGTAVLVTDPHAAVGLPGDRGGNALFYGNDHGEELHAFWDVNLPALVAGSPDGHALARTLAPLLRPAGWRDHGNDQTWASRWAGESLIAARKAYAGVAFGHATLAPDGSVKRIDVTVDMVAYGKAQKNLAALQLAKAGYHLAEMLNAIFR